MQIKAVHKQRGISAIAFTDFVPQTTEQDVQAAGYVGYFSKPVDLDEFIAAMAVLTQTSHSHQYQPLIAAATKL